MTDASEGVSSVPSASSNSPKSRRLVILQLVLVSQFLIFGFLMLRDPLFVLKAKSLLPHAAQKPTEVDYTFALASDPKIGDMIPAGAVTKEISKQIASNSKAILLVPVGECAGCIKANIKSWEIEAPKHGLSLIMLSSATDTRVSQFRSQLNLTAPTVHDPNGMLASTLNVAWPARPYLLTKDMRIVWMPKDIIKSLSPFDDPSFLSSLEKIK